jgi:hypothetical protein
LTKAIISGTKTAGPVEIPTTHDAAVVESTALVQSGGHKGSEEALLAEDAEEKLIGQLRNIPARDYLKLKSPTGLSTGVLANDAFDGDVELKDINMILLAVRKHRAARIVQGGNECVQGRFQYYLGSLDGIHDSEAHIGNDIKGHVGQAFGKLVGSPDQELMDWAGEEFISCVQDTGEMMMVPGNKWLV